jgi:hypothetical protein
MMTSGGKRFSGYSFLMSTLVWSAILFFMSTWESVVQAAHLEWKQTGSFLGPQGANSYFGSTIAMAPNGLTAFVSSISPTAVGQVSVYTRANTSATTWTATQYLTSSHATIGDQFGYSAAITSNPYTSTNIAIIGSNINSTFVSAEYRAELVC